MENETITMDPWWTTLLSRPTKTCGSATPTKRKIDEPVATGGTSTTKKKTKTTTFPNNEIQKGQEGNYEVEKVVDVRLTPTGFLKECKVRWKGFPESGDSWVKKIDLGATVLEEALKLVPSNPNAKNKNEKTKKKEEFVVEDIVGIRAPRDGSKLYKIRWEGCGEEDDTWEPPECLNDRLLAQAKVLEEGVRIEPVMLSSKKKKDGVYETEEIISYRLVNDKKRYMVRRQVIEHRELSEDELSGEVSAKVLAEVKSKQKNVNDLIPPFDQPSWVTPQGSNPSPSPIMVGDLPVTKLVCGRMASIQRKPSFVSAYFGSKRLLPCVFDFHNTCRPAKTFTLNGNIFELLSSRVDRDNGSELFGFHSHKAQEVRLTYVATSGPDLPKISLQDELDSIGDFSSLPPRKAMARLELLTSCTNDGHILGDLEESDFQLIEEKHHCGCGFYPEALREKLIPASKLNTKCIAVQVRVIIPWLGIFKGVLFPKRNIDKIQLPASMKKVDAAVSTKHNWTCVITKRAFPGDRNLQLGRQWDPEEDKKPAQSFFDKDKKKGLCKMVKRLWQCLNVPPARIVHYEIRCRKPAGIKHSFLVGVADPTDKLPAGKILITGIGDELDNYDKIFITRVPCMEPTDGILIPVVNSKPSAMSNEDWEWLKTLPFGFVIFGPPRKGSPPLPEQIANGDLDGDLYCCCWDTTIIQHIKVSSPRNWKETEKCKLKPIETGDKHITNSSCWFSKVQDEMVDLEMAKKINDLTGALYNASERVADGSKEKFMNEKLAIQLAQAYKLSLDLPKHGSRLAVPVQVRDKVRKGLHDLLEPIAEGN